MPTYDFVGSIRFTADTEVEATSLYLQATANLDVHLVEIEVQNNG